MNVRGCAYEFVLWFVQAFIRVRACSRNKGSFFMHESWTTIGAQVE